MKRLNDLKEITDEMLGGLQASQQLKRDILEDARREAGGEHVVRNTPWQSGPAQPNRGMRTMRSAAALACAAILILGIAAGIPGLLSSSLGPKNPIDVQSGGVLTEGGRAVSLDIHQGSVVITQRSRPGYRGIWEEASGANYPLIRVDGRYYRLMSNPTAMDESLLGQAIGTIDQFTSEPALADSGNISNIVQQGETVYAVRNMNRGAAAARVNGILRVFQRVSYGNTALSGGENLADTLGSAAVTALEMTDTGTVTDPATAQQLYSILIGSACLERSGTGETSRSLLIGYENGLVLQMSLRDDTLMACGSWSCPEFFEAFEAAVQQ
ncbi:MAG: hypothetical protein J5564_07080 [Clostridia bacterium]|nr:hypothetical protein [Clostridia bacterium]